MSSSMRGEVAGQLQFNLAALQADVHFAAQKQGYGRRTIDEGAMDEKSGMNFGVHGVTIRGGAHRTFWTRRN